MKLAVCEASAQLLHGDGDWEHLSEQARRARADLFLLNEMPFGHWIAAEPRADRDQLIASHCVHDNGLDHLDELGARTVLGTRPTFEEDRSVNQAFVWQKNDGLTPLHTKQFFPDEAGYHEARWFERGVLRFSIGDIDGLKVGFLTCTDVMFPEWARYYGRRGAHVIAVPRATPGPSLDRWLTVISTAAILSGCYVASSNRVGVDDRGQAFGGRGWIVDPTGQLVAETSLERPVMTADLDLSLVEEAKREYPVYVDELPPKLVAEIWGGGGM